MQVDPLRFHFELSLADRSAIQAAIRAWGKPSALADGFNGAKLYEYLERWEQFVDTDWEAWDRSEYDHDLGCRVWIQLAIEHVSPSTRRALEEAASPLDARFQARMLPSAKPRFFEAAPLREGPYFWESHTLHPDEVKRGTV